MERDLQALLMGRRVNSKAWEGRMQRRGRITWNYRIRWILLVLLGMSIMLWLSLGILLIVHADSPQNARESGYLIGYKDICTQCHRRVFTSDKSSNPHHGPSGLNVFEQPTTFLQARENLVRSPFLIQRFQMDHVRNDKLWQLQSQSAGTMAHVAS